MRHSSEYDSLTSALAGFTRLARENGLNVGIQENLDALQAAELGLLSHKNALRFSLKALFCCSEEDGERFDQIFDKYWGDRKNAVKSRMSIHNASNIRQNTPASIVMMGFGKEEEDPGDDSRNVSGANRTERLRRTDFSKVSDIDSELLEQLAEQLWRQMSRRLKRRMKASARRGRIDLRQTIRRSIASGGEPIHLMRRNKKFRKQRLIILLDVSGSMDKYSFFLLRFICALRSHFERIEAFIFSTSLIRISDYLQSRNLRSTLTLLSAQADNWSSGTKIGECFRTFNEQFAARILNGVSTTIILSDGLDTGEPELLAAEALKIQRRTRQLIWLNPLKGMKGYTPTARGMSAAMPAVDHFSSAHNLNSILELEKYLLYA